MAVLVVVVRMVIVAMMVLLAVFFFILFHTFTKVQAILSNAKIENMTIDQKKKKSKKSKKTSYYSLHGILVLSKICLHSGYTLYLGFEHETMKRLVLIVTVVFGVLKQFLNVHCL